MSSASARSEDPNKESEPGSETIVLVLEFPSLHVGQNFFSVKAGWSRFMNQPVSEEVVHAQTPAGGAGTP